MCTYEYECFAGTRSRSFSTKYGTLRVRSFFLHENRWTPRTQVEAFVYAPLKMVGFTFKFASSSFSGIQWNPVKSTIPSGDKRTHPKSYNSTITLFSWGAECCRSSALGPLPALVMMSPARGWTWFHTQGLLFSTIPSDYFTVFVIEFYCFLASKAAEASGSVALQSSLLMEQSTSSKTFCASVTFLIHAKLRF